jgi:diaminopimelate decarboxylase
MHYFHYRHNDLYCDDVKVEDIIREVGSPAFIYSKRTAIEHFRKIDNAFKGFDHTICYSIKANSNLALCHAMAQEGCGADIVSGGELYRALKAGFEPQKIVYAGVGKTAAEIKYALESDIFMFNVESLPEAELINEIALSMNQKARVSIRVNPDVNAHTHAYITTGKKENKFGINFHDAPEFYLKLREMKGLDIIGIHLHIGSQILTPEPYVDAIRRGTSLIKKLKDIEINLSVMNIGGGLGIIYKDEDPMTAKEFADAIIPVLENNKCCKLILEPGRHIVGNAGILVTKVSYIKETPVKKFVITDAGMNDLIRPCLYNAYHSIQPLHQDNSRQIQDVDVVGPICESSDFFAKDRSLPELKSGEYLAIMSAGAYGFTMSSNYNSRPRAVEVLVEGDTWRVVRRRETWEDLVNLETV